MDIYTEVINGRTVQWKLERDNRLKKIHIQVHPQEGVLVRAPIGTPPSVVAQIFKSKGTWFISCIDDISRQCPRRQYVDGEILLCLGQDVQLKVLWHNQPARIEACWEKDEIKVSLPSAYQDQARDAIRDCLKELYKQRARKWFPPRVDMLNKRHFSHQISRVTIKGQASILGSCSSLGNLNFNWRLLLAPLEIVDYVIIHELAHMQEMNHSNRFWRIVEKACPDYRRHRAWLRENSAILYL